MYNPLRQLLYAKHADSAAESHYHASFFARNIRCENVQRTQKFIWLFGVWFDRTCSGTLRVLRLNKFNPQTFGKFLLNKFVWASVRMQVKLYSCFMVRCALHSTSNTHFHIELYSLMAIHPHFHSTGIMASCSVQIENSFLLQHLVGSFFRWIWLNLHIKEEIR